MISESTLKSPSNLSTKTGQSTISTHHSNLSNKIPTLNPSMDSNLSTKLTAIEPMSTVYEESEPSTMSLPHASGPSPPKDSIASLS